MRHPVGEQHRLIFREVAVVKHQQKLGAVGIQSLNRMWNPRRKIPEIAFRYVGHKALAFQVNRRDARISVQHQGPLGSRVPMQFSDTAGR